MVAIADLQKQKEEVRARLLADEEIRGRIAFRAFEIYQRHGDGPGGVSITGCRRKMRSSHHWLSKSFNSRSYRQAGTASRIRRKQVSNRGRNRHPARHRSLIPLPSVKQRPNTQRQPAPKPSKTRSARAMQRNLRVQV